MKLLYCEDCGDIIAPWPKANRPRYCDCRSHAVWWVDPDKGILRVCATSGHPEVVKAYNGAPAGDPRAFVIGITNALLKYPGDRTPSAEEVQELVDSHPDSY